MAEAGNDAVISFDIFDGSILDSTHNFVDDLTEDEQKEMENIVTLLESVPENSLDDFEPVQMSNRDKQVNDYKLDRLAGKNSAQSTTYLTKWAVIVFKDKYFSNYSPNSFRKLQNMTF